MARFVALCSLREKSHPERADAAPENSRNSRKKKSPHADNFSSSLSYSVPVTAN